MTPNPSIHDLGTNRMPPDPKDGVVDAYGRTRNVRNLFAFGGSRFATGGAENPTLTIVALALRQADPIVKEMGRNDLVSAPGRILSGRATGSRGRLHPSGARQARAAGLILRARRARPFSRRSADRG